MSGITELLNMKEYLLSEFKDFLKSNELSKETIQNYTRVVKTFLTFIEKKYPEFLSIEHKPDEEKTKLLILIHKLITTIELTREIAKHYDYEVIEILLNNMLKNINEMLKLILSEKEKDEEENTLRVEEKEILLE